MSEINIKYWKEEDLEYVPCNICASAEFLKQIMVRVDGLSIVECKKCGLAFVNPRPKKEKIFELYNIDYFTGKLKEKRIGLPANYLYNVKPYIPLPLYKFVKKYYKNNIRGKKILEIGCGNGAISGALKNLGGDIIAIEPAKEMGKFVSKRFNVEVIIGNFENVNLKREYFDLIIALEVIEHVNDPSFFIFKAYQCLVPGGVIIISTPNYKAGKYIGENWIGFIENLEHLYYFSEISIRKLFKKHNFEVMEIEYCGRTTKCSEIQDNIKGKFKSMIRKNNKLEFLRIIYNNLIEKYHSFKKVAHQLWVIAKKT